MERKYKPIDWTKAKNLTHTDIGANPTCVFDIPLSETDYREISLNNAVAV